MQVVLDTNILVSALRSQKGAAYRVLQLVGTGQFGINLSVPLIFEYESVLHRELLYLSVSQSVVDSVIDFHCAVARKHKVFFLWRPFLRDLKDDMVLELAVKSACQFVVTYNLRDFRGIEQFAVKAITPAAFLKEIGELK